MRTLTQVWNLLVGFYPLRFKILEVVHVSNILGENLNLERVVKFV